MPTPQQHNLLLRIVKRLPSDFEPYGERARPEITDSDCSCGCRWFLPLAGALGRDWGVCANPRSPRGGLLTFEHQGCREFEAEPEAHPHPLDQSQSVGITPLGTPITAEYIDQGNRAGRQEADGGADRPDAPSAFARYRGQLRSLAGQSVDALIEAMRGPGLPPDDFPERLPQGEGQEREPFEDLDEDRWWQQHGRNPAVTAALACFDGDRAAALAWMTTPEWGLGGAHPINEAQTPDGIQHVIALLGRLARGLGA
jgi:Protein of unknown function (DUF2384)